MKRSRSPSPQGFRVKKNSLLQKVLADPKKQMEIANENAAGAKYVIDGPLRRVPPYYYTYLTFAKERWLKRTLLDVFTTEFRDKEESYYKKAIETGQVTVNKLAAGVDQVLKNGDLISHRTHKHEQPVSSRPIKIVYEDDDMVVIDKPGGIPAHPTGRFNFNSVVQVLKYEHNLECHPCNRLDRLTSGLMFLAKNPKFAERIGQQIRDREVSKQYLARVVGEFPLGTIVCEEPVSTVNPKVALNMVDYSETGKESKTTFQRVSYDGTTSIVKCQPHTGRTHQIRVHLQFLGHPIANDPVYSNPQVWGDTLGKLAYKKMEVPNDKVPKDGVAVDVKDVSARLDSIGKTEPARSWWDQSPGERLSGGKCEVCSSPLYTDPGPNDLDLWLHAMKYAANDGSWSFETAVPDWAAETHNKFMEMALREAEKAPLVDSAFCVGAVLVKDGQVLETGYTRELEGNTHAEQCALEKYAAKHGSPVPDGTVLYTSMEPCSLRLSGNEPCVDRILKTPIKTVFVGVVEPGDFVKENDGQKKLEDAGVIYLHIPGFEDEAIRIAKRGHSDANS